MDPKSEEYIKRSERAATEIATWPKWMQRNLRPTKVSLPEPAKPKQSSQSEQR